ncbi:MULTISPECIES: SRPBCC family protein [Sphingomonadaceae]|nr:MULTISPECIES: SRPBCC family protein [Sphingomonadaceae]AIT82368.1 hypothetical protein JI59_22980 [Novosphingobium pentaromativorans US6-1]KKC25580.1 hypothetical protein WP12_13010 [Sphingomonas sp. SRS2]
MEEETSFTINMSPIRVWSHLTDFKSFTLWHPIYCFEEVEAEPDKPMPLRYALFRGQYRIKAEATLILAEKPDRICWTIGISGMVIYDETYTFKSVGSGCEVRHAVNYRGLFGRIMSMFSKRGLRATLRAEDGAFVRFLKKEMRSAGSVPNRQRRRAQAARHARKAANDG